MARKKQEMESDAGVPNTLSKVSTFLYELAADAHQRLDQIGVTEKDKQAIQVGLPSSVPARTYLDHLTAHGDPDGRYAAGEVLNVVAEIQYAFFSLKSDEGKQLNAAHLDQVARLVSLGRLVARAEIAMHENLVKSAYHKKTGMKGPKKRIENAASDHETILGIANEYVKEGTPARHLVKRVVEFVELASPAIRPATAGGIRKLLRRNGVLPPKKNK